MKILTNKILAKFLSANPYITKEDHTRVNYYKRVNPHFKKFQEISSEVFENISSLRGVASFGILEINKNLAGEMAKIEGAYVGVSKSGQRFWGHSLELPNLKSISAECLIELIKFGGTLELNNLEKLSDEEISILSKHCSSKSRSTKELDRGLPVGIELCKLRYISEMGAKSLAKYKGERINLNSLKNIPEKAAKALKSYKGQLDLHAQGMRNPEMVYMHLEKQWQGRDGCTPQTYKNRGYEMIKCSVCRCDVYPSEIPSGRKNLIARTLDENDNPSDKYWDKCDPCLLEELISSGKRILNVPSKKKDVDEQLYKTVKKKASAKKTVKKASKKITDSQITANPIEGMKFVITGNLPLIGRAEVAEIIKDNGGKVVASISKNTNYLCSGDKRGTRLDKAKAMGVKIITEQQLLKMLPQ